jgi:hypothetical protein
MRAILVNRETGDVTVIERGLLRRSVDETYRAQEMNVWVVTRSISPPTGNFGDGQVLHTLLIDKPGVSTVSMRSGRDYKTILYLAAMVAHDLGRPVNIAPLGAPPFQLSTFPG